MVDRDAVGLALGVELAAEAFRRSSVPCSRSEADAAACRAPTGALAALLSDRQVKRRRRRRFLGIDLVLLVHRLEQVGEAADRFRRAQEQESLRLERVVETWATPSSANSVRDKSAGCGN